MCQSARIFNMLRREIRRDTAIRSCILRREIYIGWYPRGMMETLTNPQDDALPVTMDV
jgi:hypothetical protein